ncbi:hypothetical protein KS4_00620 [Poriferisphaera corsica]|uniref:Uncharacterized protein n=1 Tax=Poriferisphaera corsica TaxID=2528020 RepID=A0A517YP81_9BACT|nr:hypothetical protein [Poriferisphaera corsica]QDU32034.1 hypothetical protein KS4_00620 [Poriferisphaera corsica]
MRKITFSKISLLAVVGVLGSMTLISDINAAEVIDIRSKKSKSTLDLEGYDFGHVVEKLATSIDPLEREMETSFTTFVEAVNDAEQLLAEGNTRNALEKCEVAVESVLKARENVLNPMWDGQTYLTEQIGWVRMRLARALEAEGKASDLNPDARSEKLLDNIAKRIPEEKDPVRKKWLVAHYRTVRDLAKIKRMTDRLSPDQRKLWVNVLSVLDEASLAHQQVLMGTEVLFAQFESTAVRLDEYLTLLDTVDGASELLDMVRGIGGSSGEISAFTSSMTQLQDQLSGFNTAVENALQESMFELESTIDSIQPSDDGMYSSNGNRTGFGSTNEDEELSARIMKLQETEGR